MKRIKVIGKAAGNQRNYWTEYGGRMYQSKAEATRAQELDMLISAGEVESWEPQVKYSCDIGDKHICNYFADFVITYADGHQVVEDVKGRKSGPQYQLFRLKKRIVEAIHGIKIVEVTMSRKRRI